MNPLNHLIQVAKLNSELLIRHKDFIEFDKSFIIQIPTDSKVEYFDKYKNDVLYDSKELAGIGGMYFHMIAEGVIIIYSNDIGSQIRRIDLIGKIGKQIIICEAKRTCYTKSTVSQHLKRTKTKGRQLFWNWIWDSIVDFAEDIRNANVFLKLYEQVILHKNIERRLYITRLKKVKNKYVILSTECYHQNDFTHLKEINSFKA